MPLEQKANCDWQYEEIRSEIKRLTEVLHEPDLTENERSIAQSQLANYLAGPSGRRSTRIPLTVRLKIAGQSRVGTQQVELTSAVTANCHGCLCLSRHEYPQNSLLTLEVSNLNTGCKSAAVPARVRFIRLPGNPNELYCVGIELETPANIWGIESVPEDWFPYLHTISASGEFTQDGTLEIMDEVRHNPAYSDEIEVSAKTSAPNLSALTEQPLPARATYVDTAVEEAVEDTAVSDQENNLIIAGHAQDCDTILIPARVGFFSRLNDELSEAGEYLFERAAAFLARTKPYPQSLSVETGDADLQPARAEGKAFSNKIVSGQVRVRSGRDVRYWITIDASKMLGANVTGWFRASGPSRSDIALVLATERELENLIHGREAEIIFAMDGRQVGEFQVSIAQSGTYILALMNHFSIFMPRTFIANIELRYSVP